MNKRSLSIVGTLFLCVSAPSAFAQTSAAPGQDRYKPRQSIAYEFGSKFTSGYFLQDSGGCLVTLMVVEKSPPERPLELTAVRVRLHLNPGQIAGLDSEEGQSLNFTCGTGASVLLVETGERERLVSLQRSSLPPAREAGVP